MIGTSDITLRKKQTDAVVKETKAVKGSNLQKTSTTVASQSWETKKSDHSNQRLESGNIVIEIDGSNQRDTGTW